MSFHERRAITSLVGTVLIMALYSAYMFPRYPLAEAYSPEIFRFWGEFVLILIPVTIVAKIIIHIVFSILNTIGTNEAEPEITDERDRLVELKANTNSFYVFSVGFMLAMVSIVIGMEPSVMFVILITSGVISELVWELSMFFFYRRGF